MVRLALTAVACRSFFNLPEVLAAVRKALPNVELKVEMMEGKSPKEQVMMDCCGDVSSMPHLLHRASDPACFR